MTYSNTWMGPEDLIFFGKEMVAIPFPAASNHSCPLVMSLSLSSICFGFRLMHCAIGMIGRSINRV